MTHHQPLPQPFIISIGATKGGTGKTWTAANLAYFLGELGYAVLVLDLNPAHDLTADVENLAKAGEGVPFYVHRSTKSFEPGDVFDTEGRHYDFIICDTSQFLDHGGTREAWSRCHLMIVPASAHKQNQSNYEVSLVQFVELNPKAKIIFLPIMWEPLPKSPVNREFVSFLKRVSDAGAIVPNYSLNFESEKMIDDNPAMKGADVRFVLSTSIGRPVTERFAGKTLENMKWIGEVIEQNFGGMPSVRPSKLTSLDQFKAGVEV